MFAVGCNLDLYVEPFERAKEMVDGRGGARISLGSALAISLYWKAGKMRLEPMLYGMNCRVHRLGQTRCRRGKIGPKHFLQQEANCFELVLALAAGG